MTQAPHGGPPVTDLLEQAVAWRDDDPDPRTRAELDALLDRVTGDDPAGRATALADLADRFSGPLEFGTAGLRGEMGAGPSRMNRAVVIRAAAGLAAHLHDRLGAGGVPRVVVGFDARHDSDVFARDTCGVLVAAGCRTFLLPRALPTPVLAFAVRHLDADAGVMVTASHNPPRDNGYKVYLGGRVEPGTGRGVQIVPPADAAIAARIEAAPPAVDVPLAPDGWEVLDGRQGRAAVLPAYLGAARAVPAAQGPRDLDLVVTPLHGVGGQVLADALTAAGFAAPYVVPRQAEPDPDFPTVAFPNPEEPGALDLALEAARARGADLVVANDPDADRCAVAVPDGDGWRVLSGDELGALLGEHVLTRRAAERAPAEVDGHPVTVACSVVSSQLLGRVAAHHGVRHEETLTGFKWISRVPGLVFGYEEALGYCVAPDAVRDKDGITAALLVAELAAARKAAGGTLADVLDALARRHGVHATRPLTVRVDDLSVIPATMRRLRADPPRTLGGAVVTSAEDLLEPRSGLPPTDGLRWRTADGVRVVVRPSGTEPKLKCYLEAVVPTGPEGSLAQSRQTARQRLDDVVANLSTILGLT